MKNFVIENLSSEYGKRLKTYFLEKFPEFKERINIFNFIYRKDDNDEARYYGFINDIFDNYSLREVSGKAVIEVMDTDNGAKRSQLVSAYNSFSCSTWKNAILELLSSNPLATENDMIYISDDYIIRLVDEGSIDQKKWVKDNLSITIKPTIATLVHTENGTYRINGNIALQVRADGEFVGKALYLSSNYEWSLQKDTDGELCLVAKTK